MIEEYDQVLGLARDVRLRFDELRAARTRLDELIHAYAVVERSKFARLRRFWLSLGGLLGRDAGPDVPPLAAAPQGASADWSASALHAEIIELQAERLTLMDAVTSARASTELGDPYGRWRARHMARPADIERMRVAATALVYRPLFSVLMATYNTPERYLRAAIESVRAQAYGDWELCIADDASTQPQVRLVLEEYAARDPRIKVVFRHENGHISKATNSALELAQGEFVGFLDHDDLLTADALFEMALEVNAHRDADVIYSDEDKIDDEERLHDPHFKPDWSPDSFLSRMYTCHFSIYRRALVTDVGGLRSEYDGSQDYDLMLRISERTHRIRHVPKVLYHWRVHPASTASGASAKPYTSRAAEAAIEDALRRRGQGGIAREVEDAPGAYVVRYTIVEKKRVSIIIPTRNHADDVDRCLTSIFERSTYPDFEVVLLDNGSDDPSAVARFADWARREPRVKVVRHDVPFNFSSINNYAVRQSTGHYVLLLNNDTEVITPDWIEAMVEQAQRPTIGAVGATLLYPDNTIQHAGVIIGIGGVAGHSHKHAPADDVGYFSMLRATNNYSAVTGACLMVRREVYDQVGGLDESLAVAFNDVDFCLKVKAAGYNNVCLSHARLYHFESKSRGYEDTPAKQDRFSREVMTMFERWKTQTTPDPCYSRNLTLENENFAISEA